MNIKLKNNFTKSLLSLAVAGAVSTSFVASANTNQSKALEKDIEVITVTATRASLNINDALTSQIVINRADIDLINPISLLDLLSTVPSIDIASNGGKGQSSSVFMRGTNSDHTLILIDGIRVSSATLGSTSLNTIAPELIERIEIVQGPRAALWGSDAIGGVIQIFTRKLDGGEMFAGASFGTDNYRKYKAGIGISHGDGQTSITVNHEESDGYDVQACRGTDDDGLALKDWKGNNKVCIPEKEETDDDGYSFTSMAIRGLQNINEELTVDWVFSTDQGESEIDGSWSNEYDIKNHAWLVRADYTSTINGAKNNTVFLIGQNRDHSESLLNGESKGVFETRRNQYSLINHTQLSADLQLNIGVDHYQDDVSKSTSAYEQVNRDTTGVFAHTLFTNNDWSYEATIRHDDVETIDSEVTYNLGTGYNISNDSRVVFNYGTGFKAPTFNDLYYPESPWAVGNLNLRSEYSESAEVFFETTLVSVTTGINFYHSTIEDLISWENVEIDGNYLSQPLNVEDVEINGVELSANYFGLGGQHDFSMSYTDAENKKTGEQLIRRAKEKLNYKFTTEVVGADIYAEYQYIGDRMGKSSVNLNAYQVVNLGVRYSITPELILNGRVTNLFDEAYQTAFEYNTQGQAFYLGITYQNF